MYTAHDEWLDLAFRVGLALAAGGAVGWNRQKAGKPAGLRTHMLVSLGACLLVLVPMVLPGGSTEAVSRAIQGVAVGVGFLGGGQIRYTASSGDGPGKVRGLTSAAAIWVTAALGVAAACGLWRLLLLALGGTVLVLAIAKQLERMFFRGKHEDGPHAG